MSTTAASPHHHHQQQHQQHQQHPHQHGHQQHPHQHGHHHHHHQQDQESHSTADTKKNTERNRRISQYSRDIHNMGHSHFSHSHNEKDHKKSKQDGSDVQERPERHRKISHHSRDGNKGHHHGGRPRAGSKKEHDRHSVATSGDLHPPVEYENTYKIEPDSVFRPGEVKEIIRQVLNENLKGQKYINGMMGELCGTLSDKIKERVLQLNLHRFKIVSMVLIGQRKSQSMIVSSRCLWNQTYDNHASCEFNKDNLYAVGMVFGVYQE